MRWYAILFWIWALGSFAIFIWRRLNPPSSSNSGTSGRKVHQPEVSPGPAASWVPPAAAPTNPAQPGEQGPAAYMAEPTTTSERKALSLAELLAGITLPHGLAPLTQFGGDHDLNTHMFLSTNAASAEAVEIALADELERLRFTVRRTGEYTATATGPRGELAMEIHPHAANDPAFPTAGPGTVVVELLSG